MEQEYIAQTTLDQMVGTDQDQLLKAAIPYLPPRGQQILSIYSKVKELSNTLALFGPSSHHMEMCAASAPSDQPLDVLNDIRRYCYGDSRKMLDQMVNLIAMVQMIKVMNETPVNS